MRRFSDKEKAKALKLWQSGQYTQQQVADEIGCSIFSLKDWIKAAKNGESANAECDKENGSPAKVKGHPPKAKGRKPKVVTSDVAEKSEQAKDDIVRLFWSKNFRAVDMLLNPKDFSSEEVVKLVNEALQFAYDRFQK